MQDAHSGRALKKLEEFNDTPENDWLIWSQKMVCMLFLCTPCRQKAVVVGKTFKIFICNIIKIEEISNGSVRITQELCKSCKIGNKLIGSLIRSVQYGRPPIYQKGLVKKQDEVIYASTNRGTVVEMGESSSKAGSIKHFALKPISEVYLS